MEQHTKENEEKSSDMSHLHFRDMGSFYVGGKIICIDGKEITHHQMADNGEPITLDPNGSYVIGQMYVQYFLPEQPQYSIPLLFWHGGGLTGACWETTPDGRPGWLNHFLQNGWDSYLCDAVERGRSGFAPIPAIWEPPVSQTAEDVFTRFRFGTSIKQYHIQTARDGAFSNVRFPLEHFCTFAKQLVPRWTNTDEFIVDAYHRLLEKTGPSAIISHSQGGTFAFRIATERPDSVRALIALEPASIPSVAWTADEYRVPTLIVLGDNIEKNARWTARYGQFLKFAKTHPCVEILSLPRCGIFGNSHMLMMDTNNLEISGLVRKWLDMVLSA